MKYGISIVAVAAVMLATPALAVDWNGTAGDGLWFTGGNWVGGNVPTTSAAIENGDTVLIDSGTDAGVSGDFDLNGGSTVNIDTNLSVGGDFDFQGAGHVVIDGGTVTAGDDLKIDNDPSTFKMLSGSFETGVDPGQSGYLNMTNSLSRLEISGGSFIVEDDVENMSGTLQITGDSATQILFGANGSPTNLNGTLELVLKDGGITTIEGGGNVAMSGTLDVTLDAGFTPVAGDYTLISGASLSGAFGTENLPSTDWSVATVGNDVVLTYVPEPATMSLLAIGGLALIRRRKRA